MKALPHTRSCFVCGESNAAGLNLRFETDGSAVQARFEPRPGHMGFKGVVHGGIITAVLDESMVWACAVQTKRFAYSAELTVRFLRPVRPGDRTVVRAALATNRRDRIFEAKAELRGPADELLASATGKYLPIAEGDVRKMAADFVGDPRAVLDL